MTDDQNMDLLPIAAFSAPFWAVLLPAVLVAVLRVADVTVNVFRTVFTVQGRKGPAALAHGLEGAIWLAAAGLVFTNLTVPRMAGFVVGVMAGTYLGTSIIEWLQLGTVTVRIYADATADPGAGLRIADAIHEAGFGATTFDGTGYRGPVQMVLSTVRRRDAATVSAIARDIQDDVLVALDNDLRPVAVGARV